jgi:hypothetical protein
MTQCTKHLTFPFFKATQLTATFGGGTIVSDGGMLLVRQFDEEIGFTQGLASTVYDRRDSRWVGHSHQDLIRQRLFQIIAGYEDANDSTTLRHDPLFKSLLGRLPEQKPLASQPTFSRFENRVSMNTVMELIEEQVRTFIRTRPEPLDQITLDIDPSESRTYGQQELAFFNGHYDSWMYFPQFVCDAKSRFLLAAVLRPGNVSAVQGAMLLLSRIVQLLRAEWPHIRIDVRADSNFADPAFLNWLEEEAIPYAIGIGENKVLKALSANFVQANEKGYQVTHQPQRSFTSFPYQTQTTWPHPRRVIVKVEVTALGTNVRYVVVTRGGRSADLYRWYAERGGTVEDAIEQLKNGFEGDRLSCRRFDANAFRLALHAAAYNLMILFRERLAIPQLQSLDIASLRTKLIKVGARVERTARRLWFKLSSSWPFASLFQQAHGTLVSMPLTP